MTAKDDLDAIAVAIDSLKIRARAARYWGDLTETIVARNADEALARIRERLANSVPVEQAEMEGMG